GTAPGTPRAVSSPAGRGTAPRPLRSRGAQRPTEVPHTPRARLDPRGCARRRRRRTRPRACLSLTSWRWPYPSSQQHLLDTHSVGKQDVLGETHSVAGPLRRPCDPRLDLERLLEDALEDGKVFERERVRDRARKMDVDLGDEVRRDRQPVGERGRGDASPPRYPEADDIRLRDPDRAGAQVGSELVRREQRLARGERNRGSALQPDVSVDIPRGKRLLEPREVERLERVQAASGLGDVPGHVRVHHQPALRSDCLAHHAHALDVLPRRPAELHLEGGEAALEIAGHLLDELGGRERKVDRARVGRELDAVAAEVAVEGQPLGAGEGVPERDVSRGDGNRSHARAANEVELRVQLVPDCLRVARIAPDELGGDLVLEQRPHGGAATAYGVREAEAGDPVLRLELERHELDVRDLIEAGADRPFGPPHLPGDAVMARRAPCDPHGSDLANASIASCPARIPNSSSYVRLSPGARMSG